MSACPNCGHELEPEAPRRPRITSAACMVERGQAIETADGVRGVVERRLNTRKQNGDLSRTFLYLEDGRRLVLSQCDIVTITQEANG